MTTPTKETPAPAGAKRPLRPKLAEVLGPGLVTGASDDDPSGIATYSQAGAQFGFDLGWTLLFSWPLMCAIQEISARVGRVTGHGLAANLKRHYPLWLVWVVVVLLVVANTINLGADIGAMAAAVQLVAGGYFPLLVAGIAVICVLLEIFVRYSRYVMILKWLTISLFAYVAVLFVVGAPWGTVAKALVVPNIKLTPAYLTVVVAILGTTISPYLFFWQPQEEVEDLKENHHRPLAREPKEAPTELARIRLDTLVGMAFSNAVALAIMLTTAATLHAHGVKDIQTSAQAAQALKPIAGPFVFVLFALGILGTGLLAVPVLAGSAAYAVGEMMGWRVGLARRYDRAPKFYIVLAAAVAIGSLVNLLPIDPMKALFWSAVINGVVAVPLMVMIMLLATKPKAMGRFVLPPILKTVGWVATAVMAAAAAGMFATMGAG
jgi:NRAMP (natural resistance-associated macrophage protein)-like metal ion transporter